MTFPSTFIAKNNETATMNVYAQKIKLSMLNLKIKHIY